ncbi:hypothetical protein [Agrobacterium vitis]|uniref:Uncharacterized protein n=1 Tax=Agrobacterium vitis TaxID=373 RepID=A0A7K1RFS1_AGRVI|nr:hypothetical protein [Agrobacterium vitis]MVA56851.1 hypothetical protein [Agrobacterium vitis]
MLLKAGFSILHSLDEHFGALISACGNALDRIAFSYYSEQTDQSEEFAVAMKRSRLCNLLIKPVKSWRSFRWKIFPESKVGIEPPNEDMWPDGTEDDRCERLREALIFLINESECLGCTKVTKHLRLAINALR